MISLNVIKRLPTSGTSRLMPRTAGYADRTRAGPQNRLQPSMCIYKLCISIDPRPEVLKKRHNETTMNPCASMP